MEIIYKDGLPVFDLRPTVKRRLDMYKPLYHETCFIDGDEPEKWLDDDELPRIVNLKKPNFISLREY